MEAAEFLSILWMAADNTSQVSSRDFFDDPLGVGGWQMKKGLSHLVKQMVDDALSKGVDIVYGKPVTAAVNTDDGATVQVGDETYAALHALVTVSIGVLKSDQIAFDAQTKDILSEKIGGLSMGNMMKIIMPFKGGYFDKLGIPNNFRIRVVQDNDPYFIHARTAGANSITVCTGGTLCRQMERWDTQKQNDFAVSAIEATGAFSDVQENISGGVVATNWSSHPYYKGAYAIKDPKSQRTDPFRCGNIIFAGEAILGSPADSPGQLSGAWVSARKAVQRFL